MVGRTFYPSTLQYTLVLTGGTPTGGYPNSPFDHHPRAIRAGTRFRNPEKPSFRPWVRGTRRAAIQAGAPCRPGLRCVFREARRVAPNGSRHERREGEFRRHRVRRDD